MRISLTWLRELVEFDLSPDALADALTLAGFEVEAIEDRRRWADGVVVGRVDDCQPHPNADRLRVCQVDAGGKASLNVVCGAKNVAAGQFVALAPVGTYLPHPDLKLKPTKLRGVRSEGMICSLAELGLEKNSEGIHVFDPAAGDLAPGQDVRPLLGLDDVILDLTSTANRADALSMTGIAREVAALTGGALHLPLPQQDTPDRGGGDRVRVRVREPQACPAYIATAIEGIELGPSPQWLQRRLEAAGVRPIDNVVDVTNYVMLEWGQPLHAFDRDRLLATAGAGGEGCPTLGVRFASVGETLRTLDGQDRELGDRALVVTADDAPVALAGLMGGEATEVCETTQNLILEAAIFDPIAIRRSARSVGMRTEASTRFERGVNQVELELACQRAIELLLDLAGGSATDCRDEDARPAPNTFRRTLDLRLDRVQQVLGLVRVDPENPNAYDELRARDVERVLSALNCELAVAEAGAPSGSGRVWSVTVPPYRYRDLEREIDLIEEIARLFGYNRFCSTLPQKTEPGILPPDQQVLRDLRAAFRGAGLTELMHYSLRKPEGDRQVRLSNPLFVEYSALRVEMLSGLIEAFQYNLEQGNGPLNGFEIGRVFWTAEDGFDEADRVAGILGGDPDRGRWTRSGRDRPLTWYEAKGLLEAVFDRLNLAVEFQNDRSNPLLHPGRTASLWIGGKRLGTFGQLHPQVRRDRDLPEAVYAFELDLETIFQATIDNAAPNPIFQPYPTYPASNRDLAFFAPLAVSAADLQRAMEKAGKPLLESADLFDDYRGQGVPADQRSLAFRLTYRSGDRTLTDEEVDPIHQKVRDALAERFGVTLRS